MKLIGFKHHMDLFSLVHWQYTYAYNLYDYYYVCCFYCIFIMSKLVGHSAKCEMWPVI